MNTAVRVHFLAKTAVKKEVCQVRAVQDKEYEVSVTGVTPPQRSRLLQPSYVPQVEHSAVTLNLKIKILFLHTDS